MFMARDYVGEANHRGPCSFIGVLPCWTEVVRKGNPGYTAAQRCRRTSPSHDPCGRHLIVDSAVVLTLEQMLDSQESGDC